MNVPALKSLVLCLVFTGISSCASPRSHFGIYDMDTKQMAHRVYDDGNGSREYFVHVRPDEDVFATLQIKDERKGLCLRWRDKEGKLIEQTDLPYFDFTSGTGYNLSPDKSKLIAKTWGELTVAFLHDDAPPKLKTLFHLPESIDPFRRQVSIEFVGWVSNDELLIMEGLEVPPKDPRDNRPFFNLENSVYVYDIRNSKRKMIAERNLNMKMILSDDRKFVAVALLSRRFEEDPTDSVKVKIFDLEQFAYVAEFDIPGHFVFGHWGWTWLDNGKTLAFYRNTNEEGPKIIRYNRETGTLSETKFDIPASWEKCWMMGMYDRYWVLQKNDFRTPTSARYLYDTVTGEYSKFDSVDHRWLFAGHYFLGLY